jgi:hypothetical protein
MAVTILPFLRPHQSKRSPARRSRKPRKIRDHENSQQVIINAVNIFTSSTTESNPLADGVKKESSCKKSVSSTAERVIDLEGEISLKKVMRGGTEFPRFKEGTVYIEVAKSDEDCVYAFEKHVLARASSWFAESLNEPIFEINYKKAELYKKRCGYEARYELFYSEQYDLWILGRTVSCRSCKELHSITIPLVVVVQAAKSFQPSVSPNTRKPACILLSNRAWIPNKVRVHRNGVNYQP